MFQLRGGKPGKGPVRPLEISAANRERARSHRHRNDPPAQDRRPLQADHRRHRLRPRPPGEIRPVRKPAGPLLIIGRESAARLESVFRSGTGRAEPCGRGGDRRRRGRPVARHGRTAGQAQWALPDGAVDEGEDPARAVAREPSAETRTRLPGRRPGARSPRGTCLILGQAMRWWRRDRRGSIQGISAPSPAVGTVGNRPAAPVTRHLRTPRGGRAIHRHGKRKARSESV